MAAAEVDKIRFRVCMKGGAAMTSLIIRRPSFLDEFDRMVDGLWTTWEPVGGHYMSLDVHEAGDELVVKAELPGVGKEGFEITVDGDVLRIEAEKKAGEEKKEATYYMRERHFGRFSRTLSLPFPVDSGKATATFENGVLEIRLPKAEEAKSKRIEVK
jgi:HSP20 family molecular chaperone IbpA